MITATHQPGNNRQLERGLDAASAERIEQHDEQRAMINDIEKRLLVGDGEIKQIRDDLALNTAETKKIASSTAEIVEFFESMKGAFKVLNWIGALAKPLGAIVALGVAMWGAWTAYRYGAPPK